ncbi:MULTISPECIES: hypothetical protein [unclassified Campylobacter]|uniref:hypothetical protein n=1 Tax=unclassified Campylobacter TaxID=2593542 RepID=UPI001BD91371|nr:MULTISPECIES: hypothetical protein [unclassified Campylobacter]MBZ7976956.1 hypothetical protein [Campylobacter sp. RM12637]MBZ7980180.1 hypothetical protein [Campylobacter sp. RM12642]MBZ7984053.1 hypothetical protein [Campylobacter sp. RM12647]MBZ7993311.1 hypothetical protein [Campylobacter sp. RM9333]MBT0878375.1 hypothetical protein [Campylobacter sp. 2018MI01]
MNEVGIYVIGIIFIVLFFVTILKKVFKELDKHGDFVRKEEKNTANFTQEEVLSLIHNENEKCALLCDNLEEIFNKYASLMPENDKEKALALVSVLNTIKTLPSDELKDKLLKLLPEFEECVQKSLGDEKAKEFFDLAALKYNEIFKD